MAWKGRLTKRRENTTGRGRIPRPVAFSPAPLPGVSRCRGFGKCWCSVWRAGRTEPALPTEITGERLPLERGDFECIFVDYLTKLHLSPILLCEDLPKQSHFL